MKTKSKSKVVTAAILLVVLALFSIILYSAYILYKEIPWQKKTAKVCWRKTDCLTAEVMDTTYTITIGLMGRSSLPENSGALVVFDTPGIRSEWMKNMLIPTDFIWLGSDKKIKQIYENLQPCEKDPCKIYLSAEPVQYGVEVNAGYAKRHNLTEGMDVSITGI